MMSDELLQAILAKLDRGGSPDSKWPDHKGEYWARCPYHPGDDHPTNFSVSVEGFKCFACGEKGGLRKLAERLGVALVQVGDGGKTPPLPPTLENYAQVKALPVAFLESLGLQTIYLQGKPSVKIAYYDAGGVEIGARLRVALSGENRFKWRKGTTIHPYGLWRLDRNAGYVILCEGESDAQTFWHHGVSALGIPGASTWKPEWAQHLDGLTVYVWCEPDQGGQAFAASVGKSLPDCRIIAPPQGRKDISDCHLAGDDVPALVDLLRGAARPWRELQAERQNALATQAKQQAAALLQSPDILGDFARLCNACGLVGEEKTARLLYLAVTSRLLDKPISVVVKGPSSGGKSFTVETVLKAFPPNAFYALSSMSDRSLAYSDEPLAHRHLVLYEAAGLTSDFGTYLMRTLLSEGCIRYETVEKTAEGLKPKLIERAGPTGLIVTTTWASLHPENETRMFSATVRDDPSQTAGVLQALADRANGHEPKAPDFTAWHGLQVWLELAGCRDVTIPYAPALASLADARAVRLRRDFGAVLNLIRAHAILHQAQRGRDQYGRIIATMDDYAAVYDLVLEIIGEGVSASVSKATRETVETVGALIAQAQQEGKPTEVSRAQLAAALNLDKSAAGRRALKAIHDGYLKNLETRDKQPARYALGDPLPADTPVLPAPDVLFFGEGGRGGAIPPNASTLVHQSVGDQQNPASVGKTGGFDPQNEGVMQPLLQIEGLEPWQLSYLTEVAH